MSLCHNKLFARLFFLCFLFKSTILSAQSFPVDTSGYIPYYFSDALNFNLLVASSMGYVGEIKKFVVKGADIEAKTDEGATPLVLAVSANKPEAVAVLISLDADVNTITNKWDSPLILAARNGLTSIAEMLIRAGADINKADFHGASAIHYASVYGYLELTDMLLYYGADINNKSSDGTTPLMAALWSGYSDVADLLIQNGANVSESDYQGFTSFQIAAMTGDTAMMKILHDKGADPYSVNVYGWDALATSIRYDNTSAQKMILSLADLNKRSSLAVNPYNIAAKYSRKESISLLHQYNFPGSYQPGFDQVALTVSGRFSVKDFYSSFSMSFTEPLWKAGITAGIDTKIWQTMVLIEYNENLYLQVRDKSSFVYAGIFRYFNLADKNKNGNLILTTSLNLGKSFGNRFPGTSMLFEGRWHLVPSAGLKYTTSIFNLSASVEYLNSEFARAGKIWIRTGLSVNFYFDKFRAPGKDIKWY